jgi:hypothetical protein
MKTTTACFCSFITCLLLLFAQTASAQYNWNSTYRQRHSIDLIIGGDLGFRIINGNMADEEVRTQYLNRKDHENYKVNYRFGFNYYHGINASLALKTGLRYANPGFIINSVAPYELEQDLNEIEKEYMLRGPEYKYEYQILEIPLGMKYTMVGHTCEPYFEAGIAPTYYRETIVREVGYEDAYRKETSINENIHPWNFISFAAVGGNFNLSDHWSGFTQLTGRYQLNNLRKSILTERIISLGLEMGVRYYL